MTDAVQRLELDLVETRERESLQSPVAADEARDEVVRRSGEHRLRRVVLGEPSAGAEDRDPVAHQDRLVDVVGDEDHGLLDGAVDTQELVLEPRPRDRIERTERLVHEHHRRIGREGPREPDPLALAARELGRVTRAVVAGGQVDEVEQLVHALVDPTLVPVEEPRHGGDVLGHGHVGKEPRLLDDIADPATELGGLERADAPVADADVAFGDVDQAVDHLHRGRLAAARGPDEHADLAGRDDEREIVDGRGGHARVALRHVVEDDLRGDTAR